MKKQRFLVLILTMALCLGALTLQAYAAPKKAAVKEAFDPVYYSQAYPDVTAVFGNKADLLYKHYVKYGKLEGRNAIGEIFDAAYYALANPDVAAIFGNNPDLLYKHYLAYGKLEGRKAAAESFDAAYYAKMNPDVVAVVGKSPNALYQHYIKYGKAEGRKVEAPKPAPQAPASNSSSNNNSKPSNPKIGVKQIEEWLSSGEWIDQGFDDYGVHWNDCYTLYTLSGKDAQEKFNELNKLGAPDHSDGLYGGEDKDKSVYAFEVAVYDDYDYYYWGQADKSYIKYIIKYYYPVGSDLKIKEWTIRATDGVLGDRGWRIFDDMAKDKLDELVRNGIIDEPGEWSLGDLGERYELGKWLRLEDTSDSALVEGMECSLVQGFAIYRYDFPDGYVEYYTYTELKDNGNYYSFSWDVSPEPN